VEQKKTLIIKIGKFTGKLGLEVYERFKREVDGEWNKLQQTQIRKSSAVQSRKALEEKIIMKGLDKFVMALSTKERLEMETGQSISDNILRILIHMDEDYTLKELKTMCRERDLSPAGHKKLLAWRLLRHEVEKAKKQSG
jgi:hypothetical protein